MAKLDVQVMIVVEIDRCPRCLKVGMVQITGKDDSSLIGKCEFCEAVVRVCDLAFVIDDDSGDDEEDG